MWRRSARAPNSPSQSDDPPKQLPIEDDDTPWEPNPSFQHAFIRLNSQGECVISGPPDEVAQIKKKLIEFLTEGKSDQVPDDVRRFEIRAQQPC
jgi:hypothetical protein